MFGMHKPWFMQGVVLLNVNPMLICVPYRFGFQFISIFSSIFLFIFCLFT